MLPEASDVPAVRLGASPSQGGTDFTVWAPRVTSVDVHIVTPFDKTIRMEPAGRDYHHAHVEGVEAGARYWYRLDDGVERPDPASHHQPDGVHGPSAVTSSRFAWNDDAWVGAALRDFVIYEAHIGTLTPDGTFDAAIRVLDELVDIGITAFEVMPIAQFPGSRNWGYDGVYPYAPQDSYGGPDGFRRLVDACHTRGLSVVLDVVYNHLGPEGCYLDDFGPYFTDRYATPWGRAINFDGPGSDEVRRYFVGNALYWFEEFHVDALRLDAVHAIADPSPYTFLEELADATAAEHRVTHLIAESAANDPRLVTPSERGGFGLDAQWNDDFHHALAAVVTGERDGYFADYGDPGQLARALRDGYVFQGEYSSFRGRRHGRPSGHLEPERFVVFATNHDQTGNRAFGERLSSRVPFDDLKLLAASVSLSPYLPLLFMGEEYAETAPFRYFISHTDPDLVEAVRRGRRAEFEGFAWSTEVPDPQDETTFLGSKLAPTLRTQEPNATLVRFYRELFRLRREVPALASPRERDASADGMLVTSIMSTAGSALLVAMNFDHDPATTVLPGGSWPDASWEIVLDSDADRWRGLGRSASDGRRITIAPRGVVAYEAS